MDTSTSALTFSRVVERSVQQFLAFGVPYLIISVDGDCSVVRVPGV